MFLLAGAAAAVSCAVGMWCVFDEPGSSAAQPRLAANSASATAPAIELPRFLETGREDAEIPQNSDAPSTTFAAAPAPGALTAAQPAPTAAAQPDFGSTVVRRLEIEPKQFGEAVSRPHTGATATRGLTLELAPGVRQPIALLDAETELPPPQANALADIHEEFVERIETAVGAGSDQELDETWDREQTQADSRYRIVFGEAAYHRMQMEAARSARGLPNGPVFR